MASVLRGWLVPWSISATTRSDEGRDVSFDKICQIDELRDIGQAGFSAMSRRIAHVLLPGHLACCSPVEDGGQGCGRFAGRAKCRWRPPWRMTACPPTSMLSCGKRLVGGGSEFPSAWNPNSHFETLPWPATTHAVAEYLVDLAVGCRFRGPALRSQQLHEGREGIVFLEQEVTPACVVAAARIPLPRLFGPVSSMTFAHRDTRPARRSRGWMARSTDRRLTETVMAKEKARPSGKK